MQNELKQADRDTVSLAEHIERKIESIIAAHVTVWNVDLSDLLAKQRAKIAELQAECKRKDAQYEALRAAYMTDNAKSPANACAPEQPAEGGDEGDEGETSIGIEITVTGNKPIPPAMKDMLNDLTSMLQSVARK